MANKLDIDADLTVEFDGNHLTPEKFMKGVRAFFGLVNEITREVAGPADFINWSVQVKHGSNLVGLMPAHSNVRPAVLDAIYARVHEGVSSLENSEEFPEGMPEPALKHIRDLGSVSGTGGDADDTKVRVWVKKRPAPVTHKATAHVAALLAESYQDFGTIEGRVQVISEQGALHVFITEHISGRRVRCLFDEEALPKFMATFRKRVEVKGRITYRRDHSPISIFATNITEFPEGKELPSFRDMRGIFRETNGR